jgi:hypothetical protein
MITVITQEKSKPKLLLNANPTMALPFLDPLFVPQFPKKKLLQMKLWAKKDDAAPAPEPNFIQVPSYNRGSSTAFWTTDATLLLPDPMATRKKTRPSNPKKDWTSQTSKLSQSQS